MTETTNPQLTDVSDMYTVHRVFRREFGLLPTLVRGVAAGDTARAAVLADHGRRILTGLHYHHSRGRRPRCGRCAGWDGGVRRAPVH